MTFKKGEIAPGATPFKPGETGNPNGRPPKLPPLDQLLAKVLSNDEDGKTAAEKILEAMYQRALKGDTKAAELVLDRAYGKLRASVEQQPEGAKFQQPPRRNIVVEADVELLPEHKIEEGEAEELPPETE